MDLRKFPKQTFRNTKLNPHCEHVIRNGEPVTLTQEQREQFLRIICDIPQNPITLPVFLGMAVYVFLAIPLMLFPFALAPVFRQVNGKITALFYTAGALLVLLFLAGFVGLCFLIKGKNRKRADRFCTEAREKIRCGDFQSYVYRIEEIYCHKTYNEDEYGGYVYFWYRVGDVIFELPDTTLAYQLGKHDEILYKEPEKLTYNEKRYPVGGYFTGMLIHLNGQQRFYGI